jgi:cell volume regulation protein A
VIGAALAGTNPATPELAEPIKMAEIEYILIGASVLLLLSVIASTASGRSGIPAVLLFLGLGMLAGSEGPGGIYFDDARVAHTLGVVSLVFILFSGGLDTNWKSVRPVINKGLALSTIGVFITALLVAWFATSFIGFSWLEALLLGAIVSSTDAAAVFSVLRSRGVGLKGDMRPLLELESGSNDPMAVFLTVSLTSLLTDPAASVMGLVPMFFQQMGLGAAFGLVMGRAMVAVVNRLKLGYEGLYPVLTLSMVLLTYGLTALVGGNGFLSVYLAGLVLGNRDFIHKRSLKRFHDGITWLTQIMMFLTLGLLVFPSRIGPVIGIGLLVSAFLIFVARPAAVFLTLLPFRVNIREKALISWVGLRGALPIILATFPLIAHAPQADTIFNLVFFIVLTSVLLQGTSIPLVARWLEVDEPVEEKTIYPIEFVPTEGIKSALEEVRVPDGSTAVGKQIVKLGFPKGALIVLVNRANEFIIPSGGITLEAGDTLLVLGDRESLARTRSIVDSRDEPEHKAAYVPE